MKLRVGKGTPRVRIVVALLPYPEDFKQNVEEIFGIAKYLSCNHNDTSDFQKSNFFGSGYARLGNTGSTFYTIIQLYPCNYMTGNSNGNLRLIEIHFIL
uniref:Uncharacterized protein n=1 Tax=Candidatus Kentrum sp. TC TaxID=2126339 RepID=A0A450YQI4_9GAMM|nr:MAG: hypothetical protein BECKTC1821E_GA0114239_102841 [Candidatus Kentron sp. TC]VFK58497.1 MAG: hypothetical protein BECKTC1821F_GA0114240_102438 [Candidatus Kentron sp. TC]